jgi:hypothetical protein
MLERPALDKHFSLFPLFESYKEEKFYYIGPQWPVLETYYDFK